MKISHVKFNELLKDNKFSKAYGKVQDKKSLVGKTVMEEQYNFTITNGLANVISNGNNVTYTLLINRINDEENSFENLIIKVDSLSQITAYIIKYKSDNVITPENFNLSSSAIQKHITPIIYNVSSYSITGKEDAYDCYDVTVWVCSYAGHTLEGTCTHGEWATETICFASSGGSNDSGDSGAGSGPPLDMPNGGGGGGAPIGNNTPVGNPVNNCGNCNVPVYTAPVLEFEEEIAPPKTPCEELQKLLNNTESVDAITFLEGKTNKDKEYGFAYETLPNSSDLDEVHPIESLPNQPLKLNMGNYIGGNFIGANHTHPRPSTSGAVPMFAADDIFWLYAVSRAHLPGASQSQKDFSIYFLTLTVGSGTYAVKIKDKPKFLEFLSNNYIKFKYSLERKYNELGQMASASVLKKEFLKIINKNISSGIGLYELNSDKTDWAELTFNPLSPDSDPGIKPCKTK